VLKTPVALPSRSECFGRFGVHDGATDGLYRLNSRIGAFARVIVFVRVIVFARVIVFVRVIVRRRARAPAKVPSAEREPPVPAGTRRVAGIETLSRE